MARFAAQLNTVRAYCGTQQELLTTLTRIREMGYDGVELESNLIKNMDRQAVAHHLQTIGLKVCSIRSTFARTEYGMEDMLEEAKIFDCSNIVIGTLKATYFMSGPAGVAKYLQQAQKVCDRFAQEGLRPVYSLRFHEFMRQSDGIWIYEKVRTSKETANYLWETDLLCLTRSGTEPAEIFAQLADRMPICRLSDQKIRENDVYFFYAVREECPLGEGVFDLPSFVSAAKQAGAQWFTQGQDLCDRDPFVCLEKSLHTARELNT